MKKDVKKLLKGLRKQGFEVVHTRNGDHAHIYLDGRFITTTGHDPAPHNLRNLRAQIKRYS